MKKKLEAELISIAHRILKLKNRAELDQLQEETLKLYEKLSVLKFVEDNFNDVKPTIGFAMAEEKLENIYSKSLTTEKVEEPATEISATETATTEPKIIPEEIPEIEPTEEVAEATETAEPVNEETISEETPVQEETEIAETDDEVEQAGGVVAEEEQEATATVATSETPVTEENETEEVVAATPEPEETPSAEKVVEETTVETAPEVKEEKEAEKPIAETEPAKHLAEQPITHHREEITAEVGMHEDEQQPITEIPDMPEVGALPETSGEDTENGTGEGIDIPTGEPAVSQEEAIATEETTGAEINFDRKEPTKQREIVFEDFSKFVEPEFVRKTTDAEKAPETPVNPTPTFDDWMNWEPKKEDTPIAETPKEEPKPANPLDDWMNWEPSKSPYGSASAEPETAKEEEHKPEIKPAPVDDWKNWEPSKSEYGNVPAEPEVPKETPTSEPVPSLFTQKAPEPEPVKPTPPRYSDTFVRAMSLGLNDRIAFEKHLFGGSSEDLNRVVSQINTLNSFEEAQDFITDLVKPDYNNWNGKEEYEARFMELVEKKFR